jgi:hypothetical protein
VVDRRRQLKLGAGWSLDVYEIAHLDAPHAQHVARKTIYDEEDDADHGRDGSRNLAASNDPSIKGLSCACSLIAVLGGRER